MQRIGVGSLVFLFICGSVATGAIVPVCPPQSQGMVPVQIYLDIPRGTLGASILDLEAMVFEGSAGSVPLTLSHSHLVARDLAGSQILLGGGMVPTGQYDRLRMTLKDVVLGAGVAQVRPAFPDTGLVIPLRREQAFGKGSALFLTWDHVPLPAVGRVFYPGLRQIFPPVPPLASLAFVSVTGMGLVNLVDPESGRVVHAVAVGSCPQGMAFLADRQWLVVALNGEDALAVIDGLSLRLLRKIPLRFGDRPTRLLATADGTGLLVLNPGSLTMARLGAGSLQEQARVSVGEDPQAFAEDPGTGIVYVTTAREGVESFAGPDLHAVPALGLPGEQGEIVWGGPEAGIVVAGRWRSSLESRDPVTGTVNFKQSLCGSSAGLTLGAAGHRLYVSTGRCGEIAILDTATGVEFPELKLPSSCGRMGLAASGRYLLTLLPETGQLAVWQTMGGTLKSILDVGPLPYAVVAP